jgi:hypothetical protein
MAEVCPCETCTDAQAVHHRAQRVVPNWSPKRRPVLGLARRRIITSSSTCRSEYVSVQDAQPLTADVAHGHWDSPGSTCRRGVSRRSQHWRLDTAIAIDIKGELVVEIWGGYADKARLCEPKSLFSLCSN